MNRVIRTSTLIALLWLLGCGDPPEDGNESGVSSPETTSKGYEAWISSGVLWGRTTIPVCWENPTTADAPQRAWVQTAIEQTWEAVSQLDFTGWGACVPGALGIRIQVSTPTNAGSRTLALGRGLDGRANGMQLELQYLNWFPECRIPAQGSSPSRPNENCVRVIAIHEFGHALGFPHEIDRADTPQWCRDLQGGTPQPSGDYYLDGWDPGSVMNPCSPRYLNVHTITAPNPPMYVLSPNDVRAVQQIYGAKPGTLVGFWGKCIDVAGSPFADGARLVTADCKNRAEQRWLLDWSYPPNQTIWSGSIRNALGGKFASTVNLSTLNGTPLELRPRSSLQAQGWMMSRGWALMTVRGHGGRCLQVTGNATANGTGLQIGWCPPHVTTNGAQLWRRDEGGRIINQNGKCLDAPPGALASGTPVQMWDCHGGTNQIWDFTSPGRLIHRSSGKCLDTYSPTPDGTRVQVRNCNALITQHWLFRGPIRNRPFPDAATQCLNIPRDAPGTPVEIGACTGSEWQLFDYHW